MESKQSTREIDQLRYRGNNVPRWLRFVWTVFAVFAVIYLLRYMGPDLKVWLLKTP